MPRIKPSEYQQAQRHVRAEVDEEMRLEWLADAEQADAHIRAEREAEDMTALEVSMRRELDAAFDKALGESRV